MHPTNPIDPTQSGADALVRAGSPDPANREHPAVADHSTPERREGVPPPSPGPAHFNPERREGVPPPSPATGPKTDSG